MRTTSHHFGREGNRPGFARWLLGAALAVLSSLLVVTTPMPVAAQTLERPRELTAANFVNKPAEGVRQAPYVEAKAAAESLADDGPLKRVLVTVEATTRVPDALAPGDPFTGFGNFEISFGFAGARVSSLPSMWPLPASPIDTTFCAIGMTSCEVNPDLFLKKDHNLVFRLMIDVPCEQYLVAPWVLSARPDGYGRPDVVYEGAISVSGTDECPPTDDGIHYVVPDQGSPVGPGSRTGALVPFAYTPH